jgi:predicted alpha/beta-fold hydrolase
MPDGGILSVDWSPKLSDKPLAPGSRPKPVVLILHGLTGGSHETYVQDIVLEVKSRGYQAVVMNARGCADTELKSAQLYSGSYTDDVRRVSAYVKRKQPGSPVFAIGFSLGANILTKVNSLLLFLVSNSLCVLKRC